MRQYGEIASLPIIAAREKECQRRRQRLPKRLPQGRPAPGALILPCTIAARWQVPKPLRNPYLLAFSRAPCGPSVPRTSTVILPLLSY